MPAILNPALFFWGIGILLLGVWMWRWSSRNVIDFKGAALGAAWDGVKKGQIPTVPEDLKSKLHDVTSQSGHVGKAKKAAGMGIRHFIARVVGIASFIALLAGLGLMAAGIWWK